MSSAMTIRDASAGRLRHSLLLSLLWSSWLRPSVAFLSVGSPLDCRRSKNMIVSRHHCLRGKSSASRVGLPPAMNDGVNADSSSSAANKGMEDEQASAPSGIGLDGKWQVIEGEGAAKRGGGDSTVRGRLPSSPEEGKDWGEWAREWRQDPAGKADRLVKKWETEAKAEGRLDGQSNIDGLIGGPTPSTQKKHTKKTNSSGPSRGFGNSVSGGRTTKGVPKHLVVSQDGATGTEGGEVVDWSKGDQLKGNKELDFVEQWQGEADRLGSMKLKDRQKLATNLRQALGKETKRKGDKSGRGLSTSTGKGFGGVGGSRRGKTATNDADADGAKENPSADEGAMSTAGVKIDAKGGATPIDWADRMVGQDMAGFEQSTYVGDDAGAISGMKDDTKSVENGASISQAITKDNDLARASDVPDGSGKSDDIDGDDELKRLRSIFGSSVNISLPPKVASPADSSSSLPPKSVEKATTDTSDVDDKTSGSSATTEVADELKVEAGGSNKAGGNGQGSTEEDELKRLRMFEKGVSMLVGGARGKSENVERGENEEKADEERIRGFGRASARVVNLGDDCRAE